MEMYTIHEELADAMIAERRAVLMRAGNQHRTLRRAGWRDAVRRRRPLGHWWRPARIWPLSRVPDA
jgi:hypothetical protein